MPNVMTAIQPVLFEAAQIVSQEPMGLLNSIQLDFDASEPVALGEGATFGLAIYKTGVIDGQLG